MNRFEELEAFVAVVDYQGFSRAGEKLAIAKSMLSRRVSQLEKRLGVQLLQRTTRRQALTAAGREFYRRAAQILADMREAEQFIGNADCDISGKITLTLPLGFGVKLLAEPISRFMQDNPGIEIDINLSDHQLDLIEEAVDLAIRVGELPDSSLIARQLTTVPIAVCASPEYLAEHGGLQHPAELSEHQVLVYSNVSVGRQWQYRQQGKRVSPRVKYRLTANNGEFLAAAAACGLGLVSGPLAYLQEYIDRGELVELFTDLPGMVVGMYAVYPPGRLLSRRVKLLSDSLHQHFRDRGL